MSRASRGFRIAGRVIKIASLGVVFGVIIFLLWRIFSAGTPGELKSLRVNDGVARAYEESDGQIYMFRQNLQKTTNAERNRGLFTVSDYVIIPKGNQIQVVYRYTNGVGESLVENRKLEKEPEKLEGLFSASILVMTDLTPDNDKDNAGDDKNAVSYTRVYASKTEHKRENLYNYYRCVYDFTDSGVSLEGLPENKEILGIYFDIYYVGDLDENRQVKTDAESGAELEAYGSLMLYEYKGENTRVFPSGSELRAIKKYSDK